MLKQSVAKLRMERIRAHLRYSHLPPLELKTPIILVRRLICEALK
jgi:hypothetical protein